jgi:hypothetical protein
MLLQDSIEEVEKNSQATNESFSQGSEPMN